MKRGTVSAPDPYRTSPGLQAQVDPTTHAVEELTDVREVAGSQTRKGTFPGGAETLLLRIEAVEELPLEDPTIEHKGWGEPLEFRLRSALGPKKGKKEENGYGRALYPL